MNFDDDNNERYDDAYGCTGDDVQCKLYIYIILIRMISCPPYIIIEW